MTAAALPQRLVSGLIAASILAIAAPIAPSAAQNREVIENEVVVLQGLDKITARVFPIEARVGQTVEFGTLEIVARTCQETPPTEPPESAAYLDITEIRPGEPPELLFNGWMFASSPALSALEHPVYDVWVVDCRQPISG